MKTVSKNHSSNRHLRARRHAMTIWLVALLALIFTFASPVTRATAKNNPAVGSATRLESDALPLTERKAVIWRPEDKWKTSSGYNWDAIESELQDMRNAGITWARIFYRQSEPVAFLDQLIPLAGQYNVKIVLVLLKTDPAKDLGTPTQQATYRTWLSNLVNRYKGSVRYWEIENEENLSSDRNVDSGWHIDQTDGSDPVAYAAAVASYLEVLKQAYTTIKAIDPTLQVLIGGL